MEDTERLFVGVILKRSLGSEDHTMSATAFDYGIYLQKNDCTAKFTGCHAGGDHPFPMRGEGHPRGLPTHHRHPAPAEVRPG